MSSILLIAATLWANSAHPVYERGPIRIDKRAEVHRLDVDEAGPLAIEVEQITADVKVAAYLNETLVAGPVNAPGHTELHEVIYLTDIRAGTLEIRVELATPGSPPGQYLIRIARPTAASPESIALQQQFEAALSYENVEARAKSVQLYLRAANSWLTANDWQRSIQSRVGAGIIAYQLGDKANALEILSALIAELERHDHPLFGGMLVYLGRVEFQRGEQEHAERLLRRALQMQSALGQHHDRAYTLNNLALMLHVSGKLDQATPLYEESLALFRAEGNRTESATLLNNLGGIHYMRGELDQAIEHFQNSLATHQHTGNKSGQADALGNIGLAHRLKGDYVNFVSTMIDLLRIREELNDQAGMARARHRLGAAYVATGAYQRAIAMLEESKAIQIRLEENRTLAATLRELGRAYAYAGSPAVALQNLAQASALSERAGETGAAAEAQLVSAQIMAGTLGDNSAVDLEGAWRAAREAMDLLARTEDRVRFGRGYLTLGEIALASGRTSDTVETLNKSAELLEGLGDRLGLVQAYSNLARAKVKQQNHQDAMELTRKAAALIAAHRGQIANPILRAAYQSSARDAYDILIDLILMSPTESAVREAFAVAESLKAQSLRELLDSRSAVSPDKKPRKNLIDRLTALSSLREQALGDEAPQRLADLEALINEVLISLDELDERDDPIRTLTADKNLAARLQGEFSSDQMLVSFHLGETRSTAWILTRKRFLHRELPSREVLQDLVVNALHELGSRQSSGTDHAKALSDALLGPLAGDLQVEQLLLVPDDFLFLVPYAALPLPNSDLRMIQRHQIGILQSAHLFSQSTEVADVSRALLVGDPIFDRTDPRVAVGAQAPTEGEKLVLRSVEDLHRLPHTQNEVADISSAISPRPTDILIGGEATKVSFLSRSLANYEILHFATHAVINDQYPELSGLMFSAVTANGHPADPLLPVIEILGLSLRARLVVLSACDTAGGKELRGEGILSLSYAFAAAGARGVIATLWPIEDRSASHLMRNFYRHYSELKGNSLVALREAQLDILADPRTRNPVHWAGFVHYGAGSEKMRSNSALGERFTGLASQL